MTGDSNSKDAPSSPAAEHSKQEKDPFGGFDEAERRQLMVWVGEHLPEVRQTASGQRPVYWILALGLVLGLMAHVGGYEIRNSTTSEPLGLIADLLYALGFALWTGVIVVVFVQILPEMKRRQYQAALDTYEAAVGEKADVSTELDHAQGGEHGDVHDHDDGDPPGSIEQQRSHRHQASDHH